MIRAIAILLLMTVPCMGAEFLIRAKGSWNDGISTAGMTADQLRSYNARSRKGDVVVVMPDGHVWGSEECLPDFIIVKVPSVSVETAQTYIQAVYEETGQRRMLKRRRFRIPEKYINTVIKSGGVATFTNTQLISRIEDKLGL